MHRDAEPASGPGGEGEGSVVCLGDAFDDCQAEADTCVVGAYAFGAAKKRLGKRGKQLWGELLAGGFDGEAASFCEGEECFGGFFGYEGQVDVVSGEGSLVGAAE